MSSRINLFQTVPALVKTLSDASQASHNSSLDITLKNLVDIRASQLNGCAFCLDMHVKQAKLHGERELRLYHVAIWRESPLFTAKEKAALALSEALTQPGVDGVPDALYREAREHFSEVELSELTFAIAIINAWNRLMIASRTLPGALDKAYGLDRAHLE
ncbi:carboxymuconolactone decarboxylase family protein [Kosakonia oryziphila]|jgi:alkylhydroperoxidase AhpD family core domain|uniref:Alkylhydroperoxidase AhpD family core domain-containing protein n=1 Tax=Kosakonia oryziphila TaxID=1005667 RepID=A0A1C4CMJ9_9ENTR|nr:carboxymuconolactone decarboxylase family protein [Kosakonia oryziphila]SCC20261.1 alkylhydroperoxidase AhpD family core domain-containing protein [Kosakonia oryziphila]